MLIQLWPSALEPNFDVIVFETFVFDRPHEHGKYLQSGEDFQKPPYMWLKTPFTCGREVQTEKNVIIQIT